MAVELSGGLRDTLLHHVLIGHPFPLKIERDWTWEVIDAAEKIVLKCSSHSEAEEFVQVAERCHEESKKFETQMKEEGLL